MSTISPTSDDLHLLDSSEDFHQHSLNAITQARRNIVIFSDHLDPYIYEQEDIVNALSAHARSGRHCQVKILVRHTEKLLKQGHALVRLSQKLPSKILLRKITTEPTNKKSGLLMCDQNVLVYKHDDQIYHGFANYSAIAEVKSMQEIFMPCWELGVEDIQLRRLHL